MTITYFTGDESTFPCDNGLCINKMLECDGQNNCGAFSDERSCSKQNTLMLIHSKQNFSKQIKMQF